VQRAARDARREKAATPRGPRVALVKCMARARVVPVLLVSGLLSLAACGSASRPVDADGGASGDGASASSPGIDGGSAMDASVPADAAPSADAAPTTDASAPLDDAGDAAGSVLFGVNIHPIQGAPANDVPQVVTDTQMLGFKHLRMDLAGTEQIPLMNDVLSAASEAGIAVVVDINRDLFSESPLPSASQAYTQASTLAAAVVAAAPATRTWECGNEYDLHTVVPGKSGASYTDYDPTRIVIAREWLRGCVDAVHAQNPANKAVVNYSGYTRHGYLVGLHDGPQPDKGANLDFDISSIHHYDTGGTTVNGQVVGKNCMGALDDIEGTNVLAKVHAIGLPIWLTELHDNGCAVLDSTSEAASGRGNVAIMTSLLGWSSAYDIDVVDLYQLYGHGTDYTADLGFWFDERATYKPGFAQPVQAFFAGHGNPAR
jgi:hypothetical protein